MIDLATIEHHPVIEEITDILSVNTQNGDRPFFRITAAYFLSVMATTMRAKLQAENGKHMLMNCFALSLAESGAGKGYSMDIMEMELTKGFRETFTDYTLPSLSEHSMRRMSSSRAGRHNTDPDDEFKELQKDYAATGAYNFAFDGGSSPAIKQMRQKLLLSGAGSLNLQIDELGLNFSSAMEALTVYLELYETGRVKNKLTKSSQDNKRAEDIEGSTPSNFFGFGSPSMLLDAGKTEDDFYAMLSTGYARRCLFAYGSPIALGQHMTASEIYDDTTSQQMKAQVEQLAYHFEGLADPGKFGWTVKIPRDVGIAHTQYRLDCGTLAENFRGKNDLRMLEIRHRHSKALRLAGVFAFVEESFTLEMRHLMQAIKLVEDSGKAFEQILRREKPYAKLAKFIATNEHELTHADLVDALPFYKVGQAARNELMTLATAWGYKQHIIIRKRFIDNIEFFSGETLKETNLDEILLSYSDDFAYNYDPVAVPFEEVPILCQEPDLHWANHHFTDNHRSDDTVLSGFNMMVIDVDSGVPLQVVHDLLEDYEFITYTTKRHTPDHNRFRLLLPINYELKLDKDDYAEFVKNFASWLPFEIDPASYQRSKKWLTNPHAIVRHNKTGKLLDALPLIPKTTRNEQFKKHNAELGSLDNIERWFANEMSEGNRNNHMIRFALALIDAGMDYNEVEHRVLSFNKKLSHGLPEAELRTTVLKTAAQRCASRPKA